MADVVLGKLAAIPATALPRLAADGVRPIQALYEESLRARLISIDARDDVERLYLLFDLALAQGLGCLVLDYVTEVCSDPFCTSRSVHNPSGEPIVL